MLRIFLMYASDFYNTTRLRLVIMTKLESWKKTYNPVLFHLLNSSESPLRPVLASFTRGFGHFWPSQHGDLGNHSCLPHFGSMKIVCPGSCNHQKVVISSPLSVNTGSFKMDNCRFHLRSNCLGSTLKRSHIQTKGK